MHCRFLNGLTRHDATPTAMKQQTTSGQHKHAQPQAAKIGFPPMPLQQPSSYLLAPPSMSFPFYASGEKAKGDRPSQQCEMCREDGGKGTCKYSREIDDDPRCFR